MGKPVPPYVLNRIAKWMRIRERVLDAVEADKKTLKRDKDAMLEAIKRDFEFDRAKAIDHLATEIFESWTKEYEDDSAIDEPESAKPVTYQLKFDFGDGFYDPLRQVVVDGNQSINEKDCTPDDKRQETARKRAHAAAAHLKAEHASQIQDRFDQWALREAGKGRPVLELRYHAFLAETGALK